MKKHGDLTGAKFGRLFVLKEGKPTIYPYKRQYKWVCLCDCGKIITTWAHSLRSGVTTSCGCYRREIQLKLHTKHGEARVKKRTSEYNCWVAMKKRCFNKKYLEWKYYGGRGITVCGRWKESFTNFLADMGRRPGSEYSIDRIDNNGQYSPNNCRWATNYQQIHNRRKYRRGVCHTLKKDSVRS